MIDKLKSRWKVDSTWDVVVIFIVFSLAGSSILLVKKPVYGVLHIPLNITLWVKIPLTIMIYQVLLLFWGTVFGKFPFFWEKEKKMFLFLCRPFVRSGK